MGINYFAGTVFTTEFLLIFCAFVFLLAGTAVGLIILLVQWLWIKLSRQKDRKKLLLPQAMLLGYGVVALSGLIVWTLASSSGKWTEEEQKCAREVGYTSPAEYGSGRVTLASEHAYDRCLEQR